MEHKFLHHKDLDALRIAAFKQAPDGIVLLTADACILHVNAAACAMLRQPATALLGQPFASFIAPEDLATRPLRINAVRAGEMPLVERRLLRADGWQVDVEIRASATADGDVLALIRDISERKRIETELGLRESRLRAMFDHTYQFMGLLDVDGVLLEANRSSIAFTGLDADQLLGKPFWETPWWTHSAADQTRLRAAIAQARTGTSVHFETTHAAPDGRVIHVDFSLRPARNALGEVVYLVPEGRDITSRLETEQALRASERELRAVFSAIPDAVFTVDRDGKLLSHHAPTGSGVGPQAEAFVGLHLAEVLPEDMVAPCLAAIRRALDTGTQQQYHFTYMAAGGPRLFDGRVAPVGSDFVVALVRDVTVQRDSYERLNKIATQVPGVVYQFRLFPDGRSCFPYASEGIREIYRVAPEEVATDATPVFTILHPDDYERVVASIAASAESLARWQCEYRVRFPNGDEQWLLGNAAPERLPDGSTIWHGFITDITPQKQAQERLRTSEERFRGYFALGHVGMAIGSRDGAWLEVNARLCEMLGYPEEVLLAKGWNTLTHPEDAPASRSAFQQMQAGQLDHYTLDKRFVRGDGTEVPVNLAVRAVRRDDGSLDHTVASFTDLTDRARAEENRLQLERRLLHAQKLESLGIMAGGIAHDFNNLLTAIFGNLELARLELAEDAAARASIDRAMLASQRAADLTRQMLAYSGKGQFTVREIDLTGLVNQNAHLLWAALPKSVEMRLDLSRTPVLLRGDPGQIQQVVMNLITNAAEAIGEREGTVTLRTVRRELSARELAFIAAECDPKPGPYVLLEVVDTGCGMDAVTKERLFDPFFTTKFTGRGLGMSAVLGIMRAHRGGITVESAPGRGTTVRVAFPAVEPAEAADAALESDAAPAIRGTRGETILVVDDEPLVLELCRDLVTHLGFSVLTAQDGEAALRILGENPNIQGIILDYAMPRMNGMAALAEIRRRWPQVSVILSSGYAEAEALSTTEGPTPDAFMPKPYTSQTLRDTLLRVLEART